MQQSDDVLVKVDSRDQNDVNSENILNILDKHGHNRKNLIAILEDIQAEHGYLPEKALRLISEKANCPLADVYGVATFYRYFSLRPKGKHLVCACLGTACHVRGAPKIVAELEEQLGIKAGQTTADKEFTLETVNCLGACALGPVVVVDGHYFSKVRTSKVKQILEKARQGFDQFDIGKDERIFPVELLCPYCGRSFKDEKNPIDGYPSVGLNVLMDGRQGWIGLSCLYGSHNVTTEFDIPKGTVVDFSCPHCGSRLAGTSDCSECQAPMVPMHIYGGGTIQICSRRGCKNHSLDLA